MNTAELGEEIIRVVPPKENKEGYIYRGRIIGITESDIEVEIYTDPICKMRFGRHDGYDLLGDGSFIVSKFPPSSIKMANAELPTYVEKIEELVTRVPQSTARHILGEAIGKLNNEIDNLQLEHIYAVDEDDEKTKDSPERTMEYLAELILDSAKKADYALDEALEFIRKSNDRLDALQKSREQK